MHPCGKLIKVKMTSYDFKNGFYQIPLYIKSQLHNYLQKSLIDIVLFANKFSFNARQQIFSTF